MLQFEVPGAWELPLAARYMALVCVRVWEKKRERELVPMPTHKHKHTHPHTPTRTRTRACASLLFSLFLSLSHSVSLSLSLTHSLTHAPGCVSLTHAPGCVSRWRQSASRRSTCSFGSASLYVLNICLYADIQTDRRVVCTYMDAWIKIYRLKKYWDSLGLSVWICR